MTLFSFKTILIAEILVLFISALSVIYSKYYTDSLFIEIQKQEKILDKYELEWGQLQLELTTLTEENRIERTAINQLKLIIPTYKEIIYIKP